MSNSKKNSGNSKISFFGELSMMSVMGTIGLIALVIACFAFYGFMCSSPSKKVRVDDDAGIFTSGEIRELEEMAERLSRKEDINVIIVTTRDKGRGYSNSDDDCAEYAGDYYADTCIKTSLVNNSGICIFIDLTLDSPGNRFFWIYTYGTAYFAIDDDECYELFASQRSLLRDEEYFEAISNIMDDLDDYDYESTAAVTFFCLIIPAGLALLITAIATSARRIDKKPESKTYSTPDSSITLKDKVIKTRKIRHESSSGGAEAADASDPRLISDVFEVLKSFNALCFDVSVLNEDHRYEA